MAYKIGMKTAIFGMKYKNKDENFALLFVFSKPLSIQTK
jgi:hypothetical protein